MTTPTATPDAFDQWAARLDAALTILEGHATVVQLATTIPPGGTPATRLKVLRSLWQRLQFAPDAQRPGDGIGGSPSAMRTTAARCAETLVTQLHTALHDAIAAALQGGDEDLHAVDPWFSTSDLTFHVFNASMPSDWTGIRPGSYVALEYDRLPTNHVLRTRIPRNDTFQNGIGGARCVVLGPAILASVGWAAGAFRPPAFMAVSHAKGWTEAFRIPQIEEERRRLANEKARITALEASVPTEVRHGERLAALEAALAAK